ncbi:putative vacuolar membrane protein [Dioszegia hungarica]|uniref:Vacuolar membrane protein n=1 Tax=Dioszegia hungarica TaxID=4972 RepID=A0AA38LTR2_9TREE|nr:putative vacuolar membrane protein [Dioszegia hungarica]KAI9637137.1 putative vacuolar membrane protein [Dioszegia hungarica]
MSTARRAAVALWAIAHSATYGYHIASLNGVQTAVICDGSTGRSRWDCLDVSDNQYGFAVTIVTLGGLVGSLSADAASRRFGRLGTLRIAETGFILGALAVAAATHLWMVIIARIIIGISSGLVLVTIPPFLSLIAPERYRTVFGTLHQSSIGIGMLVAQSLSLALAKKALWRVELLVAAAIGALLLLVGLFVGKEEQDESSSADESTALLGDRAQKKPPLSVKDLLTSDDSVLRSGFLIVCVAQFAQQVCGISPVMYFSSRILQPVFKAESKLVVLGIMAVGTPFNFLPGLLPSSIGSKRILLTSALGTSLFSLLLAIGLNSSNQALSGTAVICFVISFSIGLAPIAWVVLSEVVPPEARTAVGSVAVGINWLTNFTAGSVFLPLQQYLSHGDQGEGNIFYVFSAASLVACLAIWTSYWLYNRSQIRAESA